MNPDVNRLIGVLPGCDKPTGPEKEVGGSNNPNGSLSQLLLPVLAVRLLIEVA